MTGIMIYRGGYPFNYYLTDMFTGEPIKVNEKEFFEVVGYNRTVVPMRYDKDNINRQNFYLGEEIIGYRER